jgi:streptomycin 6-kinase
MEVVVEGQGEEMLNREPGWYILKRVRSDKWPYAKVEVQEGPYDNHARAVGWFSELKQEHQDGELLLRWWNGRGWTAKLIASNRKAL